MFDFDELEEEATSKNQQDSAKINAELQKPAAPLKELKRSLWFPGLTHTEAVRGRIICIFGAGSSSHKEFNWWAELCQKEFPLVQICLVELPLHGSHRGKDINKCFDDPKKAALELDAILMGLQKEAGEEDPPIALFGHSMGATLAYALELRLKQRGQRVLKTYISGRASPTHLFAKMRAAPDNNREFLKWVGSDLVPKEGTDQINDLLEKTKDEKEGEGLVDAIAQLWKADLNLGDGFALDRKKEMPSLSSDVHVYTTTTDALWPVENGWTFDPPYSDLVYTWQKSTTGQVTKTVFEGYTHWDLCTEKESIIRHMAADFSNLLSALQSAKVVAA